MVMRMLYIYILVTSFIYAGLNKPSAGENLRYIHILFEWDQEPDATSYNLQASSNSSFNNLILNIEEEKTSYIATTNFNWNSSYYWRVKPIYSDGNTGDWMDSYFSENRNTFWNKYYKKSFDKRIFRKRNQKI